MRNRKEQVEIIEEYWIVATTPAWGRSKQLVLLITKLLNSTFTISQQNEETMGET